MADPGASDVFCWLFSAFFDAKTSFSTGKHTLTCKLCFPVENVVLVSKKAEKSQQKTWEASGSARGGDRKKSFVALVTQIHVNSRKNLGIHSIIMAGPVAAQSRPVLGEGVSLQQCCQKWDPPFNFASIQNFILPAPKHLKVLFAAKKKKRRSVSLHVVP